MNQNIEELLSQILANTNKIFTILEEHSRILNEHSKILEEHSRILNEHSKILEEHSRILNEHSKTLEEHSKMLDKHSKMFDNYDKRLQHIENVVTKLEHEHSDKLQILFDYFTTDSKRFEELKQELSKIYTILDRHDNRIYYLEFHRNQLLSRN